ncbi:MAG TPA: DUF4443 domain-containing protein [Nitrososphaeraceae archaeon]
MHTYVKTLLEISSRYAPSRILSYDMAHIFKTLQLMHDKGHISRELLCNKLNLGEGSIKTLVKHMKMQDMVHTSKSGTRLSNKGSDLYTHLHASIPTECEIPKCSIALGKYNYGVLLKHLAYAIKSGIEQRDAAVKMGALGATTLLFLDRKFVIPMTGYDSLKNEIRIYELLVKKLMPESGDVIIIGSDESDPRTAELASKSAALLTIMNHENHLK